MMTRGDRLVYLCVECRAQVVVQVRDSGVPPPGPLLCRAATEQRTDCDGRMLASPELEAVGDAVWEWYKPNRTVAQLKKMPKRFREHLVAGGVEMRKVVR